MGPHSTECGNLLALGAPRCGKSLQWGRTQLSAEIDAELAETMDILLLQWGRTQLSAEMQSTSRAIRKRSRLQWGRTQLSAEIGAIAGAGGEAADGFNGAALN